MVKEINIRLIEALTAAGIPARGRVKIVAEETGYSEGMVSRILSGKKDPADKFIMAVCSSFNIRREWLESGEKPVFNKIIISIPNIDDAKKRFMESAERIARYNASQEPEPSGVSLRNEQKVEYLCNLIKRLDPQEMNQVEEFVLNLFLKIN